MCRTTYVTINPESPMKRIQFGLLPKIIIAIGLGVVCGLFFPDWLVRIFLTVNSLFGNFLGFIIPLLILGLVAPGIADLGKGAGRLLLITALLAYCFTLFSGFFTYFTCDWVFPWLLDSTDKLSSPSAESVRELGAYFTIEMPPLMGVMTSLVLAFTLGLGMSVIPGNRLKGMMEDFKDIINRVIVSVIIPLLPLYIFGIFLNMTTSGQVAGVMGVFVKIIVVIFIMTVILLFLQFFIAGFVGKTNPFRLFKNMLPAYRYAVFRRNDTCHPGADDKEPCKTGACRFCHPALCYHPFVGKYHENCGLCHGYHADGGVGGEFRTVCRVYYDVGDCHGCSSGRSRRGYYGSLGVVTVDSRL